MVLVALMWGAVAVQAATQEEWLSDVALRQILADTGSEGDKREALVYEQGCVLNYLVLNMIAWVEGRTVVREF